MCVAIIIIKTDFINMQKELIRIKMQEQSGEKEQEEADLLKSFVEKNV